MILQTGCRRKSEKSKLRYTEQCKEYIRKYYHQKIYISDIAKALGSVKATYPEYLKKKQGRVFRNIVCICGLKELKIY